MDTTIFGFDLTYAQLAVLLVCAFAAGFTKTGVIGLGIIITPLMASVLPAGLALGFMLPMYVAGDVAAIARYRSRVMWRPLGLALPWGVAGTLAGWRLAAFIGERYGEAADGRLRTLIGFLMAAVVCLNWYVSRHPELATSRPSGGEGDGRGEVKRWYAALLGSFAGLVSMLTNSGGPIWALYFASLGLEVREVIGTSVWCFFLITVLKIPLSANLGFLNANTLKFALLLVPLTLAGVGAGSLLSGRLDKKTFALITRTLAACGAVYMIAF